MVILLVQSKDPTVKQRNEENPVVNQSIEQHFDPLLTKLHYFPSYAAASDDAKLSRHIH